MSWLFYGAMFVLGTYCVICGLGVFGQQRQPGTGRLYKGLVYLGATIVLITSWSTYTELGFLALILGNILGVFVSLGIAIITLPSENS